ncbi:PEP/pyruvate-binding domain-containing protein [Comamonas resistens]|uniref:PEP/pyruvate-binding domain-containing protein n=1 Tax=Comamonas resistens TaxID=3046670 RepID=A0ABY8STE7_9BURK|nr:PEP/pyruvate-binding domain-containing protein [Comamonas resistens]MDL5036239.1 PEP/pyruvate-binding domain-containing protein [Comamonas resistens]WHS66327.1 PEP/pyruvate-binding domain-containing protein [Comamonas resistens]
MRRLLPDLGTLLLSCTLLTAFLSPAHALVVRKPSAYDSGAGSPVDASGNRTSPASLGLLGNRADFDRLARVYDAGSANAMPHLLFVIDRQSKPAKIYFINTPRYAFHEDFLHAKHLLPPGKQALNRNYREPDRRFILGTLSWQPMLKDYSYEFWEGDQLTPQLLQTTANALKTSFFAPVRFKANSTLHEAVAQTAGIEAVTQAQLLGSQTFLPLNQGRATGRLRILSAAEAVSDLKPQDIVLLREVPISLPPVAGIVTERPSTVLSHVNLLARGWGIPNAYVQEAAEQYAPFNGQWVHIDVQPSGMQLRAATDAERQAAEKNFQNKPANGNRVLIKPDLKRSDLIPLTSLRSTDRQRCGAKAANLGEIQSARLADVIVPDGFCIPFAAYADFMRGNGLAERIARMRQQPGFATDAGVRRQALSALQAEIEQWPVSPPVADAWAKRWASQLGSQGVFVRSSSSSEDLPGFSGAGLYTTVPNVRSSADLAAAVRKVWASVYNFEAWEARQAAGIDDQQVVMSVFVQKAVDSTASGVMITRDPFDAARRYASYIAAKRGIGIRVVEGKRVAEQILYNSRSKAVQVLNRSDDNVALQLDNAGGVREVPVAAGRAVLSDELVQRLARAGAGIKQRFGGRDQDIEWAVQGDQLIILQSRPFISAPGR